MPTVWIINKSMHNYSAAEAFGKLAFLSEGPLDKFGVSNMDRQFRERLRHSSPEDYILPTSFSVMSAVACVIFVQMHNRLNLLLQRRDGYIERKLDYCNL